MLAAPLTCEPLGQGGRLVPAPHPTAPLPAVYVATGMPPADAEAHHHRTTPSAVVRRNTMPPPLQPPRCDPIA